MEVGHDPRWGARRPSAISAWLAAYDISSDRQRTVVSRRLERHGYRIQYSVFELELDRREAMSLASLVAPELGPEDSFLLLPTCRRCRRQQHGPPYPGTSWTAV